MSDTAAPPEVPTARAVLEHLVSSLVEDPDAVRVDIERGRDLPPSPSGSAPATWAGSSASGAGWPRRSAP